MADTNQPTFTLRRFLVRAIPFAVASGILWKLTATQNAAFTVWITKTLHTIVGRPAPYLYCDETTLFWHATMFPPLVALTLSAYWLSWPQRVLRACVGYVVYCGITAIAITLNESPYLQQTPLLTPLTSTLVNANYLMFGVVIWVLAAGPWYQAVTSGHGRARAMVQGWLTRICLLWLAVALIAPLSSLLGTRNGMVARAELGRVMNDIAFFPQPSGDESLLVDRTAQLQRDGAAKIALTIVQRAIEADQESDRPSGPLWYLSAHLINSLRPDDPELRAQFKTQAAIALKLAKKTRSH